MKRSLTRKTTSRGQRVKTFTASIPQPDLTRLTKVVTVYFSADTGLFAIYDGAHMFATAREAMKYDSRVLSVHDDRVTCNTMATLTDGFDTICEFYARTMRDAAKRKVIRFTFKRNLSATPDQHGTDDISFCGTPAVHFTYEVLYRVGDLLYYKRDDDPTHNMQYRGRADEARGRDGEAITVDWTEEREAFFANMQASLVDLINRVENFQKNLLTNVDKAIAASGPLMLEHKP